MNARHPIRRLFIANRGEIAVRIIQACRKLGIEVVVGISTADRETLAAKCADRSVCIGPPPAGMSYLRKDVLVAAALATCCDAVHPGYGFLAEHAEFERLCREHNLTFIGPSADAISAMGDKLRARQIAESLDVPTVPGSDCARSPEDALVFGRQSGYPFLLKAAAGGGGRGMRVVRSRGEVESAFESASAEARAAFDDSTLYIERFIEHARHVEIQVIADGYGHIIHLGERDCSTQRRHQKLIEEAPSPIVAAPLREKMTAAAVRIARHVDYLSAGTVEFIVDLDSNSFYFLEMNTRIQVEHPVTEMVTETDIVAEMIQVAAGEPLSMSQSDVVTHGHAIECRINAEAPDRNFMPCPGRVTAWRPPTGQGIRVDSHCYEGYMIPPFYDSMIGKLIVHDNNRVTAIAKMEQALADFVVEGVDTTIPFHQAVLAHPSFRDGQITTQWVESTFMEQRGIRTHSK